MLFRGAETHWEGLGDEKGGRSAARPISTWRKERTGSGEHGLMMPVACTTPSQISRIRPWVRSLDR